MEYVTIRNNNTSITLVFFSLLTTNRTESSRKGGINCSRVIECDDKIKAGVKLEVAECELVSGPHKKVSEKKLYIINKGAVAKLHDIDYPTTFMGCNAH